MVLSKYEARDLERRLIYMQNLEMFYRVMELVRQAADKIEGYYLSRVGKSTNWFDSRNQQMDEWDEYWGGEKLQPGIDWVIITNGGHNIAMIGTWNQEAVRDLKGFIRIQEREEN